jgi:hypothetical protein
MPYTIRKTTTGNYTLKREGRVLNKGASRPAINRQIRAIEANKHATGVKKR